MAWLNKLIMTCSCPSVKGHLTNKSTAFAPSRTNYGTQSLIHDHMMAHYQMIDRAKSTIDNKPPKSMKTFMKAHSKKVQFEKQKNIFTSRSNSVMRSHTAVDQSRSNHDENYSTVRPHTAPSELRSSNYIYDDTLNSEKHMNKSLLFKDVTGHRSLKTATPIHERRFNETNQFLSHQFEDLDLDQSFISKRSSTPISYKTLSKVERNKSVTPRYKIEMYSPDPGPPAIKGSVFNVTKPISIVSKWKNKTATSYGSNNSNSQDLDTSFNTLSLNNSFSVRSSRDLMQSSTAFNSTSFEYTRLQKQDELIAEEQAYLKFVEDITSDVLTRGIFSDRVLNQVFDSHVERRKNDLNEDRMRDLIEELKSDLNIGGEEKNVGNGCIP